MPNEFDPSLVPFTGLGGLVLHYSFSSARQCSEAMETGRFFTSEHLRDRFLLPFLEIRAYYFNIAINSVMARHNASGKENYELIEKSLCEGIEKSVCEGIFTSAAEVAGSQLFTLGFVGKDCRAVALAYFLRDSEALNLNGADIRAYCVKHDKDLSNIPESQMAIVLFSVRLARAFGVNRISFEGGEQIAVMGLNKIAIDHVVQLQTAIQNSLH